MVNKIALLNYEHSCTFACFQSFGYWNSFFLHLKKVAITFRYVLAHDTFLSSACSSLDTEPTRMLVVNKFELDNIRAVSVEKLLGNRLGLSDNGDDSR